MTDDRLARGISRRRFLLGAAAAGVGAMALPGAFSRLALAADLSTPSNALVFVFLRGGLDGLSALVPLGDSHYHDARPQTAIAESEAGPLDDLFGLHPSLAALQDLWADGLLAFVPAAGMPMANRSHFARQDALDRGTADASVGTGWMARHLQSRQIAARSVPAVDLSGALSPAMLGSNHGVVVNDVNAFRIKGFDASPTSIGYTLGSLYNIAAPKTTLERAGTSTFTALKVIGAIDENAVPAPAGARYVGQVGVSLRQVAVLLRSGIGVELANLDVGGWDLHNDQGDSKGRLAVLLSELGQSLAAFVADISGMLDRVTVVVASEFGRRVEENSSAGTDHGQGGVAMVIGRGVQRGVHGAWPGLDSAVLQDGDVPVANDVRNVLAEVVHRRLGNPNIASVFPGLDYRPLGLF